MRNGVASPRSIFIPSWVVFTGAADSCRRGAKIFGGGGVRRADYILSAAAAPKKSGGGGAIGEAQTSICDSIIGDHVIRHVVPFLTVVLLYSEATSNSLWIARPRHNDKFKSLGIRQASVRDSEN